MSNRDFLKRHNISILDTNKKFARYRPFKYEFFSDEEDYSIMSHATMQYDTERLLTIEIPESNLSAIEDFENQVFANIKAHGPDHYLLFNDMIEEHRKEKYYKNKHPAVKKAYEHYKLMLILAENGDIDA